MSKRSMHVKLRFPKESTELGSGVHFFRLHFFSLQSPETGTVKYLVYRVWMRHLHYTHNLDGEPPPPVIKPSKKGPTTAKVLTAKEKQDFLLLVGL